MSDENSQLAAIAQQLTNIEAQLETVKHHPSQNGGWAELMGMIERIDARLGAMEMSLNDPVAGTIARVKELSDWRSRADTTLDGNRKQDERLLKLEMQVALYNKITWAIGAGVMALMVKAFMSVIVPGI
jgi:chromosome segregation ATPase